MVAKSQISILADNTLPTSSGSSASSTVSKPIKGATKPCFGCGCGDEECDCIICTNFSSYILLHSQSLMYVLMWEICVVRTMLSVQYNNGGKAKIQIKQQITECSLDKKFTSTERSAAGAGGWLKWILSPPEAHPAKELAMRGKK
ncbi:hypothetical protein CIHG_01625 [Coccidioides immitis H538.4]|uniref:Uncharacterized protein n=3 Tax=Coccidioides immitis TaxID=5501 RepID=A0A0J8U3T5_COCIT|nr:hypothetical protein CIRG_01476 [Coccidioides immitis RMSCC 2394]KMU81507.1 hypothetical protein CISG_09177 [Coccidioides immitis RMSCC 3703]KMU83841.1 hypothetical protein CIHG_01625 [Coccidioides immitis H538.4]